MPKPLQYKAGSLIYFRGDPADKVFLLQNGKVNLVYQDIETGEDVHDLVQQGEFFGVKSALGRYPREENAIAIQDATAMTFSVPEFEELAAANTRIIMKMLKVLSNQLRKVHKQVSSLMAKEEQSPEAGLFSVGEYYLKNKKTNHARYVFNRYLTYYPSGKNAAQAASKLQQIEGLGSRAEGPTPSSNIGTSPAGGQDEAANAYYDAVSFISQQKYQQAFLAFKKIMDANEDAEYVAKSTFEIGHCLFLMNKFDECINFFTTVITKYPKHPELADALFYMGQSYEKSNKKDQARTFYNKVLTMSAKGDDGTYVKAKRALNALEG